MKQSFKISLVFVVLSLSLVACRETKQQKDNTRNIVGMWKYAMLETSPTSNGQFWNSFNECLKQDTFVFNADGTGEKRVGMAECTSNTSEKFIWEWVDGNATILKRTLLDDNNMPTGPTYQMRNVSFSSTAIGTFCEGNQRIPFSDFDFLQIKVVKL